MKESKTIKFTNACISHEDGIYRISETTKDEIKTYSLTERLEEFIGVEGITLQLGKVTDIPSEE
jgi:hypothetical protein